MAQLNFHHLNYFRAVARAGSLTGAARQLHISQSALSTQIRQLEDRLGQALFERRGRSLVLTEAGRIALDYAESIHASASELLAVLRDGGGPARKLLRIGAVATLSRNFQESFVEPLLGRDDVTLVLHSGSLGELLTRLSAHQLDLVLSNRRVDADAEHPWRCRRIARQPVSLVGKPRPRRKAFRFPPCQQLAKQFPVLERDHGREILPIATDDDGAVIRGDLANHLRIGRDLRGFI